MAEPIQLQFEFPDNTANLNNSWSGLAGISKDIRDSWAAVDDSMKGTLERADGIREKLDDYKDLLIGLKSLGEEIKKVFTDNDNILKGDIQFINQILQNANNVGSVMSSAEGRMPGSPAQGLNNPLANPMAYQAYANQMRQIQTDPFYGASGRGLNSQFATSGNNQWFDNRGPVANVQSGGGGFRGGNTTGGNNLGGIWGGGDEAWEDNGPANPGNAPTTGASGRATTNVSQPKTNSLGGVITRSPIPFNLAEAYPNLSDAFFNAKGEYAINAGNYQNVPYYAINAMAQQMGELPFMNTTPGQIFTSGAQNMLSGYAKYISTAAPSNYGQTVDASGNPITNGSNLYNNQQLQLMNVLNKISGFLGGTNANGTPNPGSFGSKAINAAGIYQVMSGFTGLVNNTGAYLRDKVGYPSQEYADVLGYANGGMGLPQYAQLTASAGTFAVSHDLAAYSYRDALNAAMAATELGLKGGDVSNYRNIDYTLQTQYGMNQQEVQTMMGTSLAYGVNMNQFASGLEQARQLGSRTNTSTAYVNQNFQSGVTTAASIGLTGNNAVAFGNSAVQFGAGNQIAQQAGMTGQELLGTNLGNALLAQQLGVPFMDVYAALQSPSMTAAKALGAEDKAWLGLLQNIGIPVNSIKKLSDLNPYAIKLGIILPQLGVSSVTTPQQATVWAFQTILAARGVTAANTSKTGSSGTSGGQGTPSAANSMIQTGGLGTDTSNLNYVNNALGLANTSSSVTTSNGVTVQINLSPSAAQAISATVSNTASTAAGYVPNAGN